MPKVSYYREITEGRAEEFLQKGVKRRFFFPHRIYFIPKCGPDGYQLAHQACGVNDPNKSWEVILFATGPRVDEFPEELFFDDDLIWHQQQFGKPGQIATANLVVVGKTLYSMVHISDLVQRISRRREHKTRIETRFKGWPYMLINSIMIFALENDIREVHTPTSDLAIDHTDPLRTVQAELFERVYDRAVARQFQAARKGRRWVIDVAGNRDRAVIPESKEEMLEGGKTICVCHDVERGLGYSDTDSDFAELANKTSPDALEGMLRVEEEMNVKATYNVLGCFLNEVRSRIEADGHCIAFHSYDHKIGKIRPSSRIYHTVTNVVLAFARKSKTSPSGQLARCRQVDYRIKGYRLPRSQITLELSDQNLCFHNFEWLASSTHSLATRAPKMENRLVKIPILFDDFDLFKKRMTYQEWEREALETIAQNEFVAFCLHDCYAQLWLRHYKRFIEKVQGLGTLKTLNQVASEVILTSSGEQPKRGPVPGPRPQPLKRLH